MGCLQSKDNIRPPMGIPAANGGGPGAGGAGTGNAFQQQRPPVGLPAQDVKRRQQQQQPPVIDVAANGAANNGGGGGGGGGDELVYEDLDSATGGAASALVYRRGSTNGQYKPISLAEAQESLRRGEKVFAQQQLSTKQQKAQQQQVPDEAMYSAVDAGYLAARAAAAASRPAAAVPALTPTPAAPSPSRPTSMAMPSQTNGEDVSMLYTTVVKKNGGGGGSGGGGDGGRIPPTVDINGDFYQNMEAVNEQRHQQAAAAASFSSPPIPTTLAPPPLQESETGELYENLEDFIPSPALSGHDAMLGAPPPLPASMMMSAAGRGGGGGGGGENVGSGGGGNSHSDYMTNEEIKREAAAAQQMLYEPLESAGSIAGAAAAPTFLQSQPFATHTVKTQNERHVDAWKRLKVDRVQAERHLAHAQARPGQYLIRVSQKIQGEHVLSMVQPDGIAAHFRLILNPDGTMNVYDILNAPRKFPSLMELLVFYEKFDPKLPGGLPALLKGCIPPP
eukprot:UC1_evm1s1711